MSKLEETRVSWGVLELASWYNASFFLAYGERVNPEYVITRQLRRYFWGEIRLNGALGGKEGTEI